MDADNTPNSRLEERLDDLAARLARLERAQGIESPQPQPQPQPQPDPQSALAPATPSAPEAPRAAPPLVHPKTPPRSHGGFEQFIGARLFAWIGALIVVVAAAYFAKFAYDKGWIGAIDPAVRAVLLAGFGVLLLGAGEVVFRRFGRAAALGLFIAGIGTLYLDAFASTRILGIVGPTGGFVLLGLASLVGIAFTVRGGMLSLGVFSLLAGYLAPFLVEGGQLSIWMPTYFSLLLVAAFVIASIAPKPFGALRGVTLGLHLVPAGIWMGMVLTSSPATTSDAAQLQIFLAFWWALIAAQGLFVASRGAAGRTEIVLGIIATTLFAIVAPIVVRVLLGSWHSGLATLACAAIAVVLAVQFGSGGRAFRKELRSGYDRVTLLLFLEAAVLVAVGLATLLGDRSVAVAWLALGFMAIELSRRIAIRGTLVYAMCAGVLGTLVTVATLDSGLFGPGSILVEGVWGAWAITIDSGTMYLVLAAAFWVVGGVRSPRGEGLAIAMTSIGSVVIVACVVRACGSALGPVLLAALAVGLVDLPQRRVALSWSALVVGIASAGYWIVGAAQRMTLLEDHAISAFLNPGFVSIVVVGGALWVIARNLVPRSAVAGAMVQLSPILLGGLLALGVGFELSPLVQTGTGDGFSAPWRLAFLWLTVIVGMCGVVVAVARSLRATLSMSIAALLGAFGTILWLSFGSALLRVVDAPAAVTLGWNFQFMSGVVCGCVVAFMAFRVASRRSLNNWITRADLSILAIACVLWLGSIALDRGLINDAELHGFGVTTWWSVFGVSLVVVGFRRSTAVLRWLGLGLIALAAAKLLLFDLASTAAIWRVVTGGVLGLLMVGTSILYVRDGGEGVEDR